MSFISKRLAVKLLALLVLVLIIGAGIGGFYLGRLQPKTLVVKGVDNIDQGIVVNSDFGVFWETWKTVKDIYLRGDKVKDQDLIYGGAKGLVDSLKDPYSAFLKPDDAKKFSEDINGSFGGIGAEIGIKNEALMVVAPLKNSPAEKAGLRSGDKILEINASSTVSMSINEAVKLIRGPKGTQVNLTIGRKDVEKPIKVLIVRDTINVPILEWEMKDGKLAHLKFFTFTDKSPALISKALFEIKNAGAKGMILDMRNNPGGYLDSAVAIAGFFLDKGKIVVFEEFRSGERQTFTTSGSPLVKDLPLVLLINNGSASASEILAGAIRDHRQVKIIGEKSFGKGTVQELRQLKDGSTIKITIAHWILPGGKQIDGNGVEPDIEIKITDEDIEQKRDPQLGKALEVLSAEIK